MSFFAYINSEINDEDTVAQRAAVSGYAAGKEMMPLAFMEGGRPVVNWPSNKLGVLLENANDGDVLIFPSLDILGRSSVKVFAMVGEVMDKGVSVHSVKENIVFDRRVLAVFAAAAIAGDE